MIAQIFPLIHCELARASHTPCAAVEQFAGEAVIEFELGKPAVGGKEAQLAACLALDGQGLVNAQGSGSIGTHVGLAEGDEWGR
jgi:hypothetical protein